MGTVQQGHASRTAVLVCQGRAAADGRIATGRFADPVAVTLLRTDERAAVAWVRDGTPPQAWGDRMAYESVRAVAEVIVPRTVAIDDALRAHPAPQLVILGAGLDARAWRMPELSTVEVFEIDQPASQAEKQARVDSRAATARSVRFVPVDFARDRLDEALARAGHRRDAPTTWIWEGVIPYLRREDVVATLRMVGELSAPGSRLIANYQAPSVLARAGRLVARALAGRRSALHGEPWRCLWRPARFGSLLHRHGFTVVDDDSLYDLAGSLGSPREKARSLRTGRVAVADRVGSGPHEPEDS